MRSPEFALVLTLDICPLKDGCDSKTYINFFCLVDWIGQNKEEEVEAHTKIHTYSVIRAES